MTSRNDRERLCLVVNPHSAAGATGGRIDDLRRAADRWFAEWDVRLTEGPRHASALATQAVKDGFHVVAAIGGDGTASETVHGLFDGDRPLNPDVVFTAIPAGTGSDFVRTLKMPRDLHEALRIAAAGETRTSDAVHVTVTAPGTGEARHRIGINVIGFGINGDVVRRSNQMSKRFGGRVTFLVASLRAIAAYRPHPVYVTWSDGTQERSWEGSVVSGFLANGAYCGGGMWVGRGGSMQDGLLDVVLVSDIGPIGQVRALPRLYAGEIGLIPGAVQSRATRIDARPVRDGEVLVDVDGEQPGSLPLAARVLPGTVRIRGVWG